MNNKLTCEYISPDVTVKIDEANEKIIIEGDISIETIAWLQNSNIITSSDLESPFVKNLITILQKKCINKQA